MTDTREPGNQNQDPNEKPEPLAERRKPGREGRDNPYRQQLEDQGFALTIPEKYKGRNVFKDTDLVVDGLTGLVVEDEKLQLEMARRLSDSIRDGKPWALVYGDADNLKTANNVHRDFGDMVIVSGAARTIQAVEGANLDPQTEAFATRQTGAADETLVWLHDTTPDGLERLQATIKDSEQSIYSTDPVFNFSNTIPIITQEDPRLQPYIEATREWLQEDPTRVAEALYKKAKEFGDYDAKIKKIAKDMARLPTTELLSSGTMKEFINIIRVNLGNSRISEPLLAATLRLTSIKAVLSAPYSEETRARLTEELGVSEEEFRGANTEEKRIELFKKMFNEPEE